MAVTGQDSFAALIACPPREGKRFHKFRRAPRVLHGTHGFASYLAVLRPLAASPGFG
jgi:hypothetical protein